MARQPFGEGRAHRRSSGCGCQALAAAPAMHRQARATSPPHRPAGRTPGCGSRPISSGSMSSRITFSASSTPQLLCCQYSRVPIASTTSAVFHNPCPSVNDTASGCVVGITPLPRRNDDTGACSSSATAWTSAPGPSAPPPTTINGRLAAAQELRRRVDGLRIGTGRRRPRRGAPIQPRPPGPTRRSRIPAPRRPAGRTAPPRSPAPPPRRLRRRPDSLAELHDVAQQADLVADFVQMPVPLVDRERRNLPDQPQHRRAHGGSEQQRRRRIQHARPRHHCERLRLAGHQRGAQRHVRRGLLMPGMDHPQPVRRANAASNKDRCARPATRTASPPHAPAGSRSPPRRSSCAASPHPLVTRSASLLAAAASRLSSAVIASERTRQPSPASATARRSASQASLAAPRQHSLFSLTRRPRTNTRKRRCQPATPPDAPLPE